MHYLLMNYSYWSYWIYLEQQFESKSISSILQYAPLLSTTNSESDKTKSHSS